MAITRTVSFINIEFDSSGVAEAISVGYREEFTTDPDNPDRQRVEHGAHRIEYADLGSGEKTAVDNWLARAVTVIDRELPINLG